MAPVLVLVVVRREHDAAVGLAHMVSGSSPVKDMPDGAVFFVSAFIFVGRSQEVTYKPFGCCFSG